jgi:hypothetical protein
MNGQRADDDRRQLRAVRSVTYPASGMWPDKEAAPTERS